MLSYLCLTYFVILPALSITVLLWTNGPIIRAETARERRADAALRRKEGRQP